MLAYIVVTLAHSMRRVDRWVRLSGVLTCGINNTMYCRLATPFGKRAKMVHGIGWFPFYASTPVTQCPC